jgi:hypothetical protein
VEQAEKKRLTARWLGEALRETAVLVLVFVPLDWYLGRQDRKISAGAIASTAAVILFGCGVRVGYDGEWRREHDGKPDVE